MCVCVSSYTVQLSFLFYRNGVPLKTIINNHGLERY